MSEGEIVEAPPFFGKIIPTPELTFDTSILPPESTQYLSNSKYEDSMFFEVRENDNVLGFAKVELPDTKELTPEFLYRYINPDQRRRGIGQKLRDAVYSWLKEQGYTEVSSGINSVGTILPSGEIRPNLDSKDDGGWKSYLSMTKSDSGNVAHTIDSITIERNGSFDLSFRTKLHVNQPTHLPANPKDLGLALERSILPENEKLVDARKKADEETVIVVADRVYYDFVDWIKKHNG